MTAGDADAAAVLCVGEVNNNSNGKENAGSEPSVLPSSKYSLRARSIKKRIETEYKQTEPKVRQPRAKARPPPLSKYRRKTANARERDRMKDINQGFDVLERSLPELTVRQRAEKVTKITVLRLAIEYIQAMREILASEPPAPGMLSPSSDSDGGPSSVVSSSSSMSSSSSVLTDFCGALPELPDPLDAIEGLTDFHLPGGLDVDMLLDIKSDSDGLDLSCDDFSDLPSP